MHRCGVEVNAHHANSALLDHAVVDVQVTNQPADRKIHHGREVVGCENKWSIR